MSYTHLARMRSKKIMDEEIRIQKWHDLTRFCDENDIIVTSDYERFLFHINGELYSVINQRSRCDICSQDMNRCNDSGRVFISDPLRVVDIYNDLKDGYKLDLHGNRIF